MLWATEQNGAYAVNIRIISNFTPQLMKPRGIISHETRSATELLQEAVDIIEAAVVVGDDEPAIDLIVDEQAERRERLK